MPAIRPATTVITKNARNNKKYCSLEKEKFLPDTSSNNGSNKKLSPSARTKAIKDKRTASQRNCLIREAFSAPSTFLTPISNALFEERAVERFIKLTHAISKVTMVIDIRIDR